MAWTTPITSNSPADKVTITTFDEIGSNLVYLKERADVVDDNQLVRTTDDVSFPNVTATTRITTPTGDITTVNATTVNASGMATVGSITTDNVAIKHKLFTGTLDSSGDANFAHGLTSSNILNVSCIINSETISSSTFITVSVENIAISNIDTYASLPYKCLVTYQA